MERYFEINKDGHNVRCKLYAGRMEDIQEVLVFGHGFGGHKDNKAAGRFAQRVLSKYKHAAVVTFDWPCHGNDVKKKLHLSDCGTYLSLVLAYLQEHFAPKAVYAYATSFGGYLFLKYIAENGNPFKKIALRCPAVDMYAVLTKNIIDEAAAEKLAKGKDVTVGFDRKVNIGPDFLEELRRADITQWDFIPYAEDILILHGTKDEIVPIASVQAFAEENIIECIPVENADHRFTDPRTMDTAIQYILQQFAL